MAKYWRMQMMKLRVIEKHRSFESASRGPSSGLRSRWTVPGGWSGPLVKPTGTSFGSKVCDRNNGDTGENDDSCFGGVDLR